jgi:aryl-alcohol dehydrogenase-like predicted oxidoreductase
MKLRRIGEHEVSAIGLGGMYMSIQGRPEESVAIEAVHAALDHGLTFIDTADVYCLDDRDIGHNERLFRKALAGRKEHVIVATKGGLERKRGGAWARNAHPDHLVKACEASLKALGVESIAIYQLHAPDPEVPFADSVGALAKLHAAGKIRAVGLSNVSAQEIEQARAIVPIVSVQNRWNPGHRAPETDGVLALCTQLNIAFLPYSPFGGATGAKVLSERGKLGALAASKGMSAHRLVLAWMLAKSPVVLPIPGTRRAASILDSLAASEVVLSEAEVAEVEAAF